MSKEKNQKLGRHPMTKEEKETRQNFLATETISARTKRVVNPILKRNIKLLMRLVACAKSSRYYFDDTQKEKILNAIADQYAQLENAFKETTSKEIEDIL